MLILQSLELLLLKVIRVGAPNIADDDRASPVSGAGAFLKGIALDVLGQESSDEAVSAAISVDDFFIINGVDSGSEHEVKAVFLVVVLGDNDGVMAAGDDEDTVKRRQFLVNGLGDLIEVIGVFLGEEDGFLVVAEDDVGLIGDFEHFVVEVLDHEGGAQGEGDLLVQTVEVLRKVLNDLVLLNHEVTFDQEN